MNRNTQSFAERHPRLNTAIAFLLLLGMFAGGLWIINLIVDFIASCAKGFIEILSEMTTKLDAVVVVALITATVSLLGVIISSIVAKVIDYRKSRQEYLAKKREQPYGQFVDMVYKVQQYAKKPGSYTQEQMLEDISKFSKEITLWGSPGVVKKWVSFRENGTNPSTGVNNLLLLEDIMNEMRKDMGLRRMTKGNLLAFFINDIKEQIKGTKK